LLARAREQLLLDLHRGHQSLAHGLDWNVLDDVEYVELRSERGGEGLRALRNGEAVVAEIRREQHAAIDGHAQHLVRSRSGWPVALYDGADRSVRPEGPEGEHRDH